MIASWLRAAVPATWRTALLRNKTTHRSLTAVVARDQRRRHPHCDCQLLFDGHRCLGWALGSLRTWERDYFAICDRLLPVLAPKVIWGIGANVGIWTLYFATKHPSVTTLVAYEPDESNLQMLRANIDLNRLNDRVAVCPIALSAKPGEAEFAVDDFTGSTGTLEPGPTFIQKY